MNIQNQSDRITKWAVRMGYSVDEHHAQTSTLYLECDHESGASLKIRIADHSECYCREDISVDPHGHTVEQALNRLAREAGLNAENSRAVKNMCAAIRSASVAKANRELREAAERESRNLHESLTAALIWADIDKNRAEIFEFGKKNIGRFGITKSAVKKFGKSFYSEATLYEGWVEGRG